MKFVKLFILSFFFCYAAQSQIFQPVKTPIKWSVGGFDSLFLPQHDTITPQDKAKAWMTIKDTAIYVWKQTKWVPISSNGNLVAGTGGGGETTSGTVAQLRALSTTTGRSYKSTDFGGGDWTDKGLADGAHPDDGATVLNTANGHYLERQIIDEVYPEWWGAIVNDNVSDTAAFGKMTRFCNANGKNIKLNFGTYDFNGPWIIPGRGNGSSIYVMGAGGRASILKFAHNNFGIAVQYGTANTNTIHGSLSDFQITADSTMHGLVISSHAPYSNAFNSYSNIYLFRVKDGIHFDGLSSNTSSNFQNFFNNVMVEEHWGEGIYCDGAMNVFSGGFIVAPYGNHGIPRQNSGFNSLAVHDYGGGNTYDNIPSEDQWVLDGNNTKVTRSTVELLQKGVANNTLAGSSVVKIGGGGISIDGFTITQVTNAVITQMMAVYGQGTNLKNISYLNPGDVAQYNIQYPILPAPGSTGVMENIQVKTVYPVNHPVLFPYSDGWSFVNVLGIGNIEFSRIKNLQLNIPAETDPTAVKLTGAGQNVAAYTAFDNFKTNTSAEFRGALYDYSSHYIAGKNGAYLSYNAPVTTTVENTRRLDYISDVNAAYRGEMRIASAIKVDSAISFTTLANSTVSKILENHVDGNNGGLTFQYKSTGSFYDGMVLDRFGRTTFSNTVSGARATQPTDLLRKDQQDSAYAASAFILRNAGGTGDTIMKVVSGSEVAMKRLSIQGAAKTVNDTSITWIVGANGTVNFTGNGSTTAFTFVTSSIPWYTIDSKIFITPVTATGAAIEWVEKSTESFTIHFLTAPSVGSKAIDYTIMPATISP